MATHVDEVPVAEVLPDFAAAFPFERFNRMQVETLPALLDSDANVVVSAPTASGKTAVAEMAICDTLAAGGTALFLAPLRALTNEKEAEWERFEDLGYSVYVVTGERDLNPSRAKRADILVMTPEKADSATRKHDSPRYSFVTDVDCCVVDEVHLLDSDRRGSVLEVTISRLRRLCGPRIVALSATMPNIEDVAAWLDAPESATFAFGDDYRPVPLHADVETYSHGENAFADKYRRLYRALDRAEPHLREDGQALVFVSSRGDTVQAAKKARDELAERDVPVGARGDYEFHTAAEELSNDTLRQSVLDGVGFHHAGLSRGDKDRVEEWFRAGKLDLLFSTSTLAWGVNLPARCVVLRDTKYHDPLEGEVDMSPLDVLQMLGRAGRPGYDDQGYAWVVCDHDEADRYRRLLREGTPIESRLAEDLDTHLNAEIALGTVGDVDDVMDWLETTFYYERATRDGSGDGHGDGRGAGRGDGRGDGPGERRGDGRGGGHDDGRSVGDPQSTTEGYASEGGLRDRVSDTVSSLVDRGFVEIEGFAVEATPLGRLASRFYLRLDTAERFAALARAEEVTTTEVLRAVARAEAFDSVSARSDEADAVDAVVGADHHDLEPGQRKVLAILQAGMDGSTPSALKSDAWVIRQNAERLLAACRAFLDRFAGPRAANLASRLEARIETGLSEDAVGLTAIDGVGESRARTLATAGLDSPAAVVDAGVEGLVSAGLTEHVAERVHEHASELPAVAVDWGELPSTIDADERALCEASVRSRAGDARAGIRVTVNGHEMTTKDTYLGETTVPVALFGGEASALDLELAVSFPELPLRPVTVERRVRIR